MGIGAAATLALGAATACEPPPPADGRDLGLVLTSPPPGSVGASATVEVGGTVTNHGTVAADGGKVAYAVDGGFAVDVLAVDGADGCAPLAPTWWSCDLAAPLEPGQTVSFTATLTAGAASGTFTHMAAISSNGTEPSPDPSPNAATAMVDVTGSEPATTEPLAMGNGTNYLGTGSLLGAAGVAGHPSEATFLAVNTYCSRKVDGDRYQAGLNVATVNPNCSGALNDEYRQSGYTYWIDVPESRTSSLDVLLYDAPFTWSGVGAVDAPLSAQGSEPFTFSLYSADSTPMDGSDNPLICAKTFGPTTPFDHGPYLGSDRWNRLCSIPTSAPAGRYLLRVRNSGAPVYPVADGSNRFGIVAAYSADAGGSGFLCRQVTRSDCPTVSGAGETSVQVQSGVYEVRIPLGSVQPHHEGGTLRIELFDPGEGIHDIRILGPNGTSSWSVREFDWSSPEVGSAQGVTYLDVRQARFNGRLVTIEVDLDAYDPPSTNDRWFVQYIALDPVTDRTTLNAVVVDGAL